MKKRILVSVDAGETRVAVLESKGTGGAVATVVVAVAAVAGNRAASAGAAEDGARSGSGNWKVGELYSTPRPRSIVDNIYKGSGQRPPRHGGRLRRHGLDRNGFLHVDEIVLPGGEAAPRRGRGKDRPNRRADQAAPGGPGPGRQGPAEDEGRAALDAALDRRPLPRLHAAGRRGGASRRLSSRSASASASCSRTSTPAREA